MLKKSIGLTAAALALGVFGLVGNGCSSTSSPAAPGDDSGTGKETSVREGGSPGDGSTGTPACYVPGSGTAQLGPVVLHQGVCTTDQINNYWDLTLNQTFDAGDDAGGAFKDFVAANVPCVQCLVGPLTPAFAPDGGGTTLPDGGSYPAPVEYDDSTDGVVFINIEGCEAAISTDGADDTCVESVEDQAATANLDCGSCVSGDDANFTATTACVNYDATSGNAATVTIDSTCASAFKAVSDADAQSKCGVGADFETTYKGLAAAFCGN